MSAPVLKFSAWFAQFEATDNSGLRSVMKSASSSSPVAKTLSLKVPSIPNEG